jgi:hypothetical protein
VCVCERESERERVSETPPTSRKLVMDKEFRSFELSYF